MDEPTANLDDHQRQIWNAYEGLEALGLRARALAVLREFIAVMNLVAPDQRRAWVEATCKRHLDEDSGAEGIPGLRYPLVVDVILPELIRGYRKQWPHYARWLALLTRAWRGSEVDDVLRRLGFPEDHVPHLLREALALDPSDARAAHALTGALERTFEYWVHEVPLGVLTDDTGAWRRELDEFEALITRYPPTRAYSHDLAEWRFHCDAWEDFLKRRDEFASYADFLEQLGT